MNRQEFDEKFKQVLDDVEKMRAWYNKHEANMSNPEPPPISGIAVEPMDSSTEQAPKPQYFGYAWSAFLHFDMEDPTFEWAFTREEAVSGLLAALACTDSTKHLNKYQDLLQKQGFGWIQKLTPRIPMVNFPSPMDQVESILEDEYYDYQFAVKQNMDWDELAKRTQPLYEQLCEIFRSAVINAAACAYKTGVVYDFDGEPEQEVFIFAAGKP